MLIVFDVDGTLLGGEKHDWLALDGALRAELGFVHTPGFFTSLGDVTAETVVAAVAKACRRDLTSEVRDRVRDGYLAGLKDAHRLDPRVPRATRGKGTSAASPLDVRDILGDRHRRLASDNLLQTRMHRAGCFRHTDGNRVGRNSAGRYHSLRGSSGQGRVVADHLCGRWALGSSRVPRTWHTSDCHGGEGAGPHRGWSKVRLRGPVR